MINRRFGSVVLLRAVVSLVSCAVIASTSIAGGVPCGIFVSTLGADSADCGLDPRSPCATIQFGIFRAVDTGAACVFVQAGNYLGPVSLSAGVDILGGFDLDWEPGTIGDRGHTTVIEGGFDVATDTWPALVAVGIPAPVAVTVADIIVRGPDVPNGVTILGSGVASLGVLAVNASLVLERCRIESGRGSDGLPGAAGTNAPSLVVSPSMNGFFGVNGTSVDLVCSSASGGTGGNGGVNPLGGFSGGKGGNGGSVSAPCPFGGSAMPGQVGEQGEGSGGAGGPPAGSCNSGNGGVSGGPVDGAGGVGALDFPFVLVGFNALAPIGATGGVGQHGAGGGGGSGSGGCLAPIFSSGAGGGGGGAGGARAVSAGAGGRGGGCSFPILAINSTLLLRDSVLLGGMGGAGGAGGAGGVGQPGGSGGLGGSAGALTGGSAGNGARGGHSGGGGGGAGGGTFAIFGNASVVELDGTTWVPGTPGRGGPGGTPAPGGAPGQDGAPGISSDLFGVTIAVVGLGGSRCAVESCSRIEPRPCVGDLNGDGVVDGADLGILLSNWGPCLP